MALSLIDKLYLQAQNVSPEDIAKICSNVLDAIAVPEKALDAMVLLRQLFFILQTSNTEFLLPSKLIIKLFNVITSPEKGKLKECLLCQRILLELLPLSEEIMSDIDKFKEKVPSPVHLQMFMGETKSITRLYTSAVRWLQSQSQDLEYEVFRKSFSFLIGLSMLQSQILAQDKVSSVNDCLGNWLMDAELHQAPNPFSSNPFRRGYTNQVTEVDGTPSTNFFTVLSIGDYYTDGQLTNIFSFSMLYTWIHHTLITLLADPQISPDSTDTTISDPIQLSSKQQSISVTPTRHLSVSGTRQPLTRYTTSEWIANSQPISKTRSIMPICRTTSEGSLKTITRQSRLLESFNVTDQHSVDVTPIHMEGSLTLDYSTRITSSQMSSNISNGFQQSPCSVSQDHMLNESTPGMTSQTLTRDDNSLFETASYTVSSVKKVFESLVGRTMDYCFRILDQCNRKTKTVADADLQSACIVEAVKLLDHVCKIDEGLIPRSFSELKHLVTVAAFDNINPRLLIVIIQFLLNHCSAVAYDAQEELKQLFHQVLSHNFNSTSISFDVVMFILDNLEQLSLNYSVMCKYFPNIFKLLAWNPHTFVCDFVEMIPVMMTATTSLEVLHMLIDLPCMTIALEVTETTKNTDFGTLPVLSDYEPTKAVDAFKNAMFRPMFNFFTRAEGGHGDTISRLDKFHSAIQDMIDHPRVLVCYQVVPVLLKKWFMVILEEGSEEFIKELLPVLMERIAHIFGIPEYQEDMKRVISENMLLLVKKYPRAILKQSSELIEFISSTRNIAGREDFFCNLIWAIGEYTSATYSIDCTADTVCHMYEILEVLTYEVIGITGSPSPTQEPVVSVKVVSTLISALAKLSSRCQDRIPRTILCLTKVARQHQKAVLDKEEQEIILNRAQELINLLKIPNFASVILNPPPRQEANRVHTDPLSIALILRATHAMIDPCVT